MSPARIRAFLLEDSERATRLHQSLPALNLLSAAERQAILRSRTEADVIAAVTGPVARSEPEYAIRAACDVQAMTNSTCSARRRYSSSSFR